MRIMSVVIVLSLSACGGTYSSGWIGDQSAAAPAMGNDARRDGFYDGGVFDPDLTRRDLPVPE
ncbi:MAG: hypothetical protein ACM3Q1_06430 [Bacteroidales bacterium]